MAAFRLRLGHLKSPKIPVHFCNSVSNNPLAPPYQVGAGYLHLLSVAFKSLTTGGNHAQSYRQAPEKAEKSG